VGQTTQLTATVKSASGQAMAGAPLAWTTANAAVATVSAAGLVTAVGAGSVVVTARSGNASGTVTIVVTGSAPTPAPSGAPSTVALPQAYVNSAMPSTSGAVIAVPANGDLQQAINQAKPGDVIELAQGATYSGNFVLPNKGSSTSWIVIRPAAGTPLPAEGQRMTPALAQAARVPRVVSPNYSPVFATASSAHHYRITGLDVTVASQREAYTLFALGTDGVGGQTTTASVPHDLVLDRLYVHGNATIMLRRCIALNSAATAVVDSYVSDCHQLGGDAQAIVGWNGPGPFKIVNNYLEASTEVVLFGGSDPAIAGLVPSDIEVRHNHLTRPMAWKGQWLVKTIFELKNARRVLVEGNVLEHNWSDAWDGTAMALKSVNQEGSARWSGTTDVTVRRNIIRHAGGGIAIGANPQNAVTDVTPAARFLVEDNLITGINDPDVHGGGKVFVTDGNLADVTIRHNTVVNPSQRFFALVMGPGGARLTRFAFDDNLSAALENWGIMGDGQLGQAAMTMYAPGGSMRGNVFAGNAGVGYPAGNLFLPDVAHVGFLDVAGGDYRLSPASPATGTATDGRSPGADLAATLAATQGAVLP
jgi:hypothetical protein